MKNYNIFLIFLFFLMTSLFSCYEDKGNYTYDWVEEVVINNLPKDTVIGWGDILSIKPNLQKTVFSQISDTMNINPEDYEYIWYTHNNDKKRFVLSTKQYLNDTIYLPVSNTNYLVNYEVTEKATGITWNSKFNLKVINLFNGGFMFLTEDEDKNVELEIYGRDAEGVEHLRKRLLYTAGFPFRSGGANCVFYFTNIRKLSRIWIATGEGTGWLSGTDFTWEETYVARYKMANPQPDSYTFKNIQSFSDNFMFLTTEQGESHLYHGSWDIIYPDFGYLNDGSKVSFYPFLGGATRGMMGYDRNSKQFVSYDLSTAQATIPSNYCFKMNSDLAAAKGMELIHMQYVNSLSQIHAYLKNPTANTYHRYSYRIDRNEANQYGGVLIESDIIRLGDLSLMEQAEHIVIERRNGYVYFSIGNKLYNYRMGSGIDACVELEYEFDDITHLTVDNISHNGQGYNVIGIATYSEANGGKVYYMQPQDTESRNLNLIKTYDGLGKVKSITKW